MSEFVAGFWAAIALPGIGILGCALGGIATTTTGKRRPSMAVGQLLKFIGITLAALGTSTSVWLMIAGISLFGIGTSLWIPGMYTIPMELKEMNSTRVGAAFALITSCGFVAGFISPLIGGWMTDELIAVANIADPVLSHVFGLKWSLFTFGFTNLIGFVCILLLKETGPAAQSQDVCCTKNAIQA